MTLFGEVNSTTDLDRVIQLSGRDWRKGTTAPTDAPIGTSPEIGVLLFDAVNELGSVYMSLPDDCDKTQDMRLDLDCSLVNIQLNNDSLDWTLDYTAPQALTTGAGIAKTSTQVTSSTTITTGNGLAVGDIYVASFTISAGDATNPLANAVGLALEGHLTNVTGVAAIHLLSAHLHYKALY